MHDEQKATVNPGEQSENLLPACLIKVNLTTQPSADNTSNIAVSSTLNAANDEAVASVKPAKEIPTGPPTNYCSRRSWVTTDRMNELRRQAQEAVKQNKTFTIRGCFNSVRNALIARGWVEKLDLHRKQVPTGICQVTYEDLTLGLPKRKPGETRRQYMAKCERNIMSRFLEHMPIDFLWTNRKEKCDFIDQAKNPGMTINKFHRAPFTSKEGLCSQLRDFHWYYEENTAELYFPRCFNVWSPEELNDFIENFKLTACISFVRFMVNKYRASGFDEVFSPIGKIPFSAIDFAFKRCTEYIDSCQHNDIDVEDSPRIWEHDWDAFLQQQYLMANEDGRILADPHKIVEPVIRAGAQLLEEMQHYWPQYSLDGYQNLWIIKPANKCRGRGIQLLDNLKRILTIVNPAIASKSRFVVQKYIERPLIIHNTKFDIRQWFLITNVQPLVVWMYKESYLRFSSQEYSLNNHHESVHLTNHAIQKKYTNGKRDKRLPIENMWDCYSFQAYLRQIGQYKMWMDRIYPGMRKAIVGTMLASQENMDRRPNTFELFGADFMITDDFYPWLIEINSSPDLGATTSVTARMCPQCLEDVVKVVIDRRNDPKSDLGNFELIYRQIVPPTPAYMGLNLFVKGKQLMPKLNHPNVYNYQRRERTLQTSNLFKQRTALIPAVSNVHRVMPVFNATEFMEKAMLSDAQNSSRSSVSGTTPSSLAQQTSPVQPLLSSRTKLVPPGTSLPCPNLLKIPLANICILRRSLTTLPKSFTKSDGLENRVSSNQSSLLYGSSKRYRSCGPRLPTNMVAETGSEQNLRCIIKKCALQDTSAATCAKRTEPSPKKTENPKSRSNRHASRLAQLQRSAGTQDHYNSNPTLRSQSSLTERQHILSYARKTSGRRLSVNARKKGATTALTDMENETEKTALESSSAAIHAIGRGLATWKAVRRQTARHRTPAVSTNSRLPTANVTSVTPNHTITTNSTQSNSHKFSERARLSRNTRC